MPYLPEIGALQTVFPRTSTADFGMQLRVIAEQYEQMYPRIQYECLRKETTPVGMLPSGDIPASGAAGATKFDPIWGESVDQTLTTWQQPHASGGTIQATDVEVYLPPVTVNARIQRISKETQLKKYGFDKVRDLTLFIPLVLLDRVDVTVKHGDRFVWNQFTYMVREHNKVGYWKNTDVAMYMALNCEQWRAGA